MVVYFIKKSIKNTDWLLIVPAIILSIFGLITMYSFSGTESYFSRQLIALFVGLFAAFSLSTVDFRFLKNTKVVMILYVSMIFLLSALFVFGTVAKGTQGWFRIGGFSFQPADFAKIVLIIVLAKYFSRRHIEIKRIRHIIVSGVYAFIFFILVALQPDFGSAVIIFGIWFGMVLVSGISYKHLAIIGLGGVITFVGLWSFVFADYQKNRIMTFIHPLADIRGAGYNAYQSMIAVGSGQVFGKGVGYGTQSRLQYLPEHQTDFIFASFAEEWGLIGVLFVYCLYMLIFWRILANAYRGATNFETLIALGIFVYFGIHVAVNIGMNMGMMPVTGVPLPFMSYGGSHLLAECIVLGIIAGMKGYERSVHVELLREQPELFVAIKK